jgi:glycosyltransferase involved in cell wall biosynthesis
MVDVILFTYNRDRYLSEAINAVLSQTYSDFLLKIVDNHSTDTTEEIINSYKDERIRYIRHASNVGPVKTGEYAYENLIEGDYCVLTHDDDIMGKDLIKREVEVMEKNPNVMIVSPCINLINEYGYLIKTNPYNLEKDIMFSQYAFIESYICGRNYICTPAVMQRSPYIIENKLVQNADFGPASDVMFWSRYNLEKMKYVYIIKDPLYNYRLHSQQDSYIKGMDMIFELDKHYREFVKDECPHLLYKYDKYYIYNNEKRIILDFCGGKTSYRKCKEMLLNLKGKYRNRFKINDIVILYAFIALPLVFYFFVNLKNSLKRQLNIKVQINA